MEGFSSEQLDELKTEARKIAVQFIRKEIKKGKLEWFNRSLNLDHKRKIYFVHNPKCMGTSLKGWLGLQTDHADHRFPTLVVSKPTWESYTTIVSVRHPVDRFLSSYNFHCKSDYSGSYMERHPDLKSWDMDRYFEVMRVHEPHCLAPQWKYTCHMKSEFPPRFVIRMEDSALELARLAEYLDTPLSIPSLNQGFVRKEPPPADFLRKLVDYYRQDFEMFGYDI